MSWCKNIHIFSKTQKAIFKKLYKNKNILNVPLALKDFGKSRKESTNNVIRFLFFGAIRENKGLEYLIEATNKLSDKYKGRFKVQIVGKFNE